MQINSKLLTIVAKAQTAEVQKQVAAEIEKSAAEICIASNAVDSTSIVDELLAVNKNATVYSIADDFIAQNFNGKITFDYTPDAGNVSDVSDPDGIGKQIANDRINSRFSIQFTGLPGSQIEDIKRIIYDLHHPQAAPDDDDSDITPGIGDDDDTPVAGDDDDTPVAGDDDDTPVAGDDDDTPVAGDDDDSPVTGDDDDTEEPKFSFIDEFDDVESMFDWLHEQDPSISKDTGITRAQLIELTQNDSWEDSNYDFFGALNRVFNVLDQNSNDILTAEEIKELIGDEIGSSSSVYLLKVEAYAAEIQAEYARLSNQKKLEFAIDRTREYLEAAGLDAQLAALDRLLGMKDLHNTIKVGQIAIADLNPDYTGTGIFCYGRYSYAAVSEIYEDKYDIMTFGYDEDNTANDAGIHLDISILQNEWYVLVETLVHELTHATAYQYTTIFEQDGKPYYKVPTQTQIDSLYKLGALSSSEYAWYTKNKDTMTFGSDEAKRFRYLARTACGEYIAYQVEADYMDSIAGDILDPDTISAADGPQELDKIKNHVDSIYNTHKKEYKEDGTLKSIGVEAEPDWKWWSYA